MVAVSFGNLGEASVEIRASLDKLNTDLRSVRTRVAGSLKDIGASLTATGAKLSAALTLPLTLFGGLALKVAGDFEQSMNRVAAVSGATGEQFKKLREQARELGATTQFSASQAADAMAFLAQAGFEADEIFGALPDTLRLAAAAQLDMGSAADIVSNIMAGFRISNEDLTSAVDVLTKAFTSSNTDLVQLGEAMKFVGPVASAAGLSFEETAAAAGLLGNAGLQASLGGTALRGAIARILNPTKEAADAMSELGLKFTDSSGRIKSLTEIIAALEPYADDAGLFMTLFGQRAGPGMAALVAQGSEALVKLTTELQNSGGAADEIARVQMQGLNGALRELKSAFEDVLISLGDSGLLDFVANLARNIADLLRQVGAADPQLLKMAAVLGGVTLVLGPLIASLGLVAIGIAALLTPVGAVVAAFAVGGVLLVAFATFGKDGLRILGDFVSKVVSIFTGPFTTIVDAVKSAMNRVLEIFRSTSDEAVGNSIVPDMVDEIIGEFQRLSERTIFIFSQIARDIIDLLGSASDAVAAFIEESKKLEVQGLDSSLEGLDRRIAEQRRVIEQLKQAPLADTGIGRGQIQAAEEALNSLLQQRIRITEELNAVTDQQARRAAAQAAADVELEVSRVAAVGRLRDEVEDTVPPVDDLTDSVNALAEAVDKIPPLPPMSRDEARSFNLDVISTEHGGDFSSQLQQLHELAVAQGDFAAKTKESRTATELFRQEMNEFGATVEGTAGPISGMIALTEQLSAASRSQSENFASTIGSIDNSFRELFGDNKKFAIASALINTALAVTRALSSAPYPYNIALAAAVGVLGAVQVATISAQEFARGGVFNRDGSVVRFAQGGVVDRPTQFRMGSGGLGVMGEAGPEAIMPLAQTSRGLGVSASGMPVPDVDVSVNIINPPSQPNVQDRGGGRIDVTFDEAVASQMRPGTATSRALKQRYNLDFAVRR